MRNYFSRIILACWLMLTSGWVMSASAQNCQCSSTDSVVAIPVDTLLAMRSIKDDRGAWQYPDTLVVYRLNTLIDMRRMHIRMSIKREVDSLTPSQVHTALLLAGQPVKAKGKKQERAIELADRLLKHRLSERSQETEDFKKQLMRHQGIPYVFSGKSGHVQSSRTFRDRDGRVVACRLKEIQVDPEHLLIFLCLQGGSSSDP